MKIATLADIEECESVALSERGLAEGTYELVRRAAEKHPQKLALRFILSGDLSEPAWDCTYEELLCEVHRYAQLLRQLGIGPTDVVSLVLPNLPETVFALLGAQAVGIVNPINPLLEPSAIADILRASNTKVLITLGAFPRTDIWQKVSEAARGVPSLTTVLQVDLGKYVRGPKAWLARAAAWKIGRGIARLEVRCCRLEEALAGQPDRGLPEGVANCGEAIAAYFHTGGTTGLPKLAQHSHNNQVFNAWGLSLLGDWEGKTVLSALPLFHVNGMMLTLLMPLMEGATVLLASPAGYRGEKVLSNLWQLIERYQVAALSAVPTVYAKLLDVPLNGADIGSLEICACGAAPMPEYIFGRFENKTGLSILEGYGSTEGTCANTVNPRHGEKRVGSVGLRLPYQQIQAVVLDEEGRFVRKCVPGESGALLLRGPSVFAGYKGQATDPRLFVECDAAGPNWLNTGDLGRIDSAGYVWLTGRKKEVIIRGGHNINPSMIEEPLLRHPQVALAAAVGRPDAVAGEVPVAYVQLTSGATVTVSELEALLSDGIGERAAIPKAVRVVEELPLTAVGKVFKPSLVDRETESALLEALAPLLDESVATVSVALHSEYGRLAQVNLDCEPEAEMRKALEDALGRFPVHVELCD